MAGFQKHTVRARIPPNKAKSEPFVTSSHDLITDLTSLMHTGYIHYAARTIMLEILVAVESIIADEVASLDKRLSV